jgi:hypothetical protein
MAGIIQSNTYPAYMNIQVPPPRRQPQSSTSTILKVLGGCCILITLIVTGVLAYFAQLLAREVVKNLADPHASHIAQYEVFATPPLIGPTTPFDLVLTIWAKRPHDLAEEEDLVKDYQASEDYSWDVVAEIARLSGRPLNDQVYPLDEELVYSEVVVKGFTLGDKHKEVDVDFEVPLKRL